MTQARQDLQAAALPIVGLTMLGLYWGRIAAWLPDIKAAAGVGDAELGALMMLSAAGGVVAMALSERALRRFGPRLFGWAAWGLALAAVLPLLVGGPWSLGVMLLASGLSMSLVDILSNVRLSEIEAARGRPLMNLAHGLYSLALAASAGAMGLWRGAGGSHQGATVALVALLAALALLARRRVADWRPAAAADGAATAAIAPWVAVLPAAAILFLSFMAENGTESWGALHIERSLGADAGLGAFGPAMFALAMGVARLGAQSVVARIGEVALLALCIAVALCGGVVLALAPSLPVAIAGAAGLGLGVAVVVPTANSLLGQAVAGAERASAITRAWLIGFTGFFVGPPLLGRIAQGAGLRQAFLLIAVMVGAMIPALVMLARQRARRRRAAESRAG